MTSRFVVFGASGDLARRYLMPALVRLHAAGRLARDLGIVGAARDAWDTEVFRRRIGEGLARHAADVPAQARAELVRRLEYRRADVTDPEGVGALLGDSRTPAVVYLALPPAVAALAVQALGRQPLAAGTRIVLEKPFGEDLASARTLNRRLRETFSESAVFRMDHFLGKQTVQNLLGLRFGNRIFEPVWNAGHIERVEIVWDESLGLEGRAGYYDRAGARRDMIQNHLLQLLCLVAMEPPIGLGERDLRDRKVDLLRAVRRLSPEEVASGTRRARYTAGHVGGRSFPAYAEEDGVDPARGTETYAEVGLQIDNWRWKGIPFLLRTGKALARDRRQIAVHFRPVPHLVFGATSEPVSNVLAFSLDPDRVTLRVNINGPGDPFDLEAAVLDLELAPQELPAYARLLLAVLEGDATLDPGRRGRGVVAHRRANPRGVAGGTRAARGVPGRCPCSSRDSCGGSGRDEAWWRPQETQMKLAMIGLRRMGGSMTERLLRAGHAVVAYAPDAAAVAEGETRGAIGAHSAEEVVRKLEPPRVVWLMIPVGPPARKRSTRSGGDVEDSGMGRWTGHEAVELAVPVPALADALFARFASRQQDSFSAKVIAALRNHFGGHAVRAAQPK